MAAVLLHSARHDALSSQAAACEDHLQANVEYVGVGRIAAVLAALQALVSNAQTVKLGVLHIGDIVCVFIALSMHGKLLSRCVCQSLQMK